MEVEGEGLKSLLTITSVVYLNMLVKGAFPNTGNHFDRPFLHTEKEVLLRECIETAIFFHLSRWF